MGKKHFEIYQDKPVKIGFDPCKTPEPKKYNTALWSTNALLAHEICPEWTFKNQDLEEECECPEMKFTTKGTDKLNLEITNQKIEQLDTTAEEKCLDIDIQRLDITNPMYRTTYQDYGRLKPNIHSMPVVYRTRNNFFTKVR